MRRHLPPGALQGWLVAGLVLPLAAAVADGPIRLRDVTADTGITFRHSDGGAGRHYMAETVASGLASFDYDGDGDVDLYLLSGVPLEGSPADPNAGSRLYRNAGGWRFEDVTASSSIAHRAFALGVAVGDYDDDGTPDLFTNAFGPCLLHRNNGDGTFTELAATAGVERGEALGAGANFLDYDRDGVLDLFVANYVDFRYATHRTARLGGRDDYARPRDFSPLPNRLYHGRGDGGFTDVSGPAGIAAHAGAGMGTICFDHDDDGLTDIFVCNDQRLDFLFRNQGDGTFAEVALAAGLACNALGTPTASMGVDAGDHDNDGRLDLVVTPYYDELPVLHRGLGSGLFEDVAARAGIGVRAVAAIKWGVGLVDFDNDGLKDLFIGCGQIYEREPGVTEREVSWPPVLFRNLGGGRFANVGALAGDGLAGRHVVRGVAFDDFDDDGLVDVVMLVRDGAAVVLRNESPPGNHWLRVRLRGRAGNRDALGARVRIVAGDLVQVAEIHSGRGYQSHFGSCPHFGLGSRPRVDRIEVRWPDGTNAVVEDVAADRTVTIVEGAERSATAPAPFGAG